ncbi:CU044_5270 family protein [Streptomyces bambusae]|uniref:CU044_5270 family protein n=1 Tax=Streptomyces bambusae TaxID=1550616 RepID=UPI001CFC85CF|nr:CU044_5270 family protein [Streptomyces bambusae]MCB5163402.1 CU044_5270 family protein [Streptomyces bambusae]
MSRHDDGFDTGWTAFDGADALAAAGCVGPAPRSAVDAALAAVRTAAAAERAGSAPADTGPAGPSAARPSSPVPAVRRPRAWAARPRRLLVTAAAVAAVTVGVSVYPAVDLPGSRPAASAGAAEFLRGVSEEVAGMPTADAPWWRVRSLGVMSRPRMPGQEGALPAVPRPMERTSWTSRTRQMWTEGPGAPWEFTNRNSTEQISWLVGSVGLTWDDLKTLPTDPQALRTRLLGGEATLSDGFFGGSGQLLAQAPVPPQVRAAFFRILADLPDIRLVGEVRDAVGRTGTAVEVHSDIRRFRLVIEPATGRLLESSIHELGGPDDGRLAVRSTYLESGPVARAPASREPQPVSPEEFLKLTPKQPAPARS